ncbi:FeoA family protein [Alkalibacter rhizosphaerae]|nr:FeoA family protein [Alkalibacter rhizosphaerae]
MELAFGRRKRRRMRNGVFQHQAQANKEVMLSGDRLIHAQVNFPYVIQSIETDDASMKDFLFTLGCFPGEEITILSILADNYIINVKDARYSIDSELAKTIQIK